MTSPTAQNHTLAVVIEPIPENEPGLFGCKRRKLIAASRGDEVDLVVDVPVLEAVLSFVQDLRRAE
jgi:hypothetical protein